MSIPSTSSFQNASHSPRKGAILIDCDDCLHIHSPAQLNAFADLDADVIHSHTQMNKDVAKKLAVEYYLRTGDAFAFFREQNGYELYEKIYREVDERMVTDLHGDVAPNTAAIIEYIHNYIQPVFIVSHCTQIPLENRLRKIGFSDAFISSQSVGIDYFAHNNRMDRLSAHHNNRNPKTDPPPGWMRKDIANPSQSIFTQLALLKNLSLADCAFFDDSRLNCYMASQMGVGYNYLISKDTPILNTLEKYISDRFNMNLHENYANKDASKLEKKL